MIVITRRVFGVFGILLLVAILWWGIQYFFFPTLTTITTDLAPFKVVGEAVKSDFTTHPLLPITEDYAITDTLKDGVEITYASSPRSNLGEEGGEATTSEPNASTTLTSPDTKESLTLQFPPTLQEPLTITLPGNRSFTVTHEVEGAYTRELLIGDIPSPRSNLGEEDRGTPDPTYLKYTSPDTRLTTYYAYQKDQAAGYRNLKHWTIFASGTGEELQSYLFHNAYLRTNDRGEVEVRYVAPLDESKKAAVGDDVWARAQAVLQADLEASLEDTPPDLIIPPPYTIDANGTKVTHEWSVTTQKDYDPSDTSGAYRLTVSFQVPMLGYPIALDPTLQFTAPGVSNAGSVITGEGTGNSFGYSLATGDFNNDGKDDLAVGANGYNSNQGRVYIFHGGTLATEPASAADVVITGEATGDFFGYSLAAGDLNNDGWDDFVVGAVNASGIKGRAYIFYNDGSIPTSASSADAILTGTSGNDNFGNALVIDDLNNDGRADLVVAAWQYSQVSDFGLTYIFYGGSIITESASGADVTITGETTGNRFGRSLTTGDFNADGKIDLAVGATSYSTNTGRTYLFYNGNIITENASGADLIITGEATGNYFGWSLISGDFNSDGRTDLIINAYAYNGGDGRAYFFYNDGSIPTTAASADLILTGTAYENFGLSFAAGDYNTDGRTDIAIGAQASSGNTIGKTYIFYNDGSYPTTPAAADVIISGETTGNYFGSALTTGDFNADGKDDLAVGATGYNSSQGRTYIFYSQSGQVNLDQHITGEGTSDYFGSAFITGDFNADGKEDLAVGASLDNTNTGKVYIFYNDGSYPTGAASADVVITGGSNTRFGFKLASGDLNADGKTDLVVTTYEPTGYAYIFYNDGTYPVTAATADVTITGQAGNDYFGSNAITGDFNADGKTDLAVGAQGYSAGVDTGRVYIFYNDGSIPTAAGSADVMITGEASSNYFGYALTAGDFNADGKTDLAVSGYRYSGYTGRVYIFYNDGSFPSAAASADVIITGDGYFGSSLTAGDFNADGKMDLAVGANAWNFGAGRVYIFYNDGSIPTTAATADVIITGENNSTLGDAMVSGDFNADGKTDLSVGASVYSSNTGRTYIFYNDGSYPSSATNADVIITGNSQNDDFGYSLTTFDYNADGRDDLVVGAPGYTAGDDTGRLYFYETRENYSWKIQRQSLKDGLRVDPLMGYEMKITGEATSNSFGTSIATGDFNADGKDDLAVGATGYNSYQGRVYIFYNDGSYGTKAGRADVVIIGESTGDYFGASLTTGDFNADGKDDLAVGASGYNSDQGRTYIFYGGSIASENASGADVTLTGEATGDFFGTAFTTGDFNADGKDDLAIGAWGYNSAQGRTYLFYGGSMISENATGSDVTLTGESTGDAFGASLTTGDFNADGKADLVVGAYGYNSIQGRTYFFYGGSIASENASGADVTLTGEATSNLFGAFLEANDFNTDGKDDLVVGAPEYNSAQGRTYLFYGGSMISENATGSDVTLTGEATGDFFGSSFETGDWNADGKDDLVVGAPEYNSAQGRTYFFYGGSIASENASGADVTLTGEATGDFFGSSFETGDWNADGKDDLAVGASGYNSDQGRLYFYTTNDYQLTGVASSDSLGSSLATGDWNADGKEDLAVGAYGYNIYQGRTYLFYGGSMISENASGADVTLTGEATNNRFGNSLTSGDWNADGKDDLAVGASVYNSSQGRTYLFYGGSMITENASGADVTLTGEATGNSFGNSLTSGDWNADGKDDLAVGATQYNTYQGRTYLFYGGSMISENASGADVTLTGEGTSNYFGSSLTTGDWNADGKDDLVVSAFYYGRVYVFYNDGSIPVTAATADVIITGTGLTTDFGSSLTTGDWNADGKDDLAVGANDGEYLNNGKVYVFYNDGSYPSTADAADVTLTGETGSQFGNSVVTGDWNADGKDDLAVGAPAYNTAQGRTYLFYGKNLRTVSATYADVIVTGQATNSRFGGRLFAADLSGNGVDDLIIGANGFDVSGASDEGRVYIISSEAATEQLSSHRFQGTIKFFGTGKFH